MTDEQKSTELRKYFFKPLPFWENLPAEIWEDMQAVSTLQEFPKKTLLYSEGSNPRALYIIRQGRVKVYIINNEGAEQIIYFLGRDEVFGHRSIVSEEPSPVFIETMDDCLIDSIPRYHFERFLRESPELNAAFLNLLGQEFRVFVNKISLFAQKPVTERVALALLVLHEKFQDQPGMALQITREDLASYIGTATENLIRQLKILKDSGAILVRGRKIVLTDLDLLWEIARVRW